MLFVYSFWLFLAVFVGLALLFWWALLIYYWIGVGIYLGARRLGRMAIAARADRHD